MSGAHGQDREPVFEAWFVPPILAGEFLDFLKEDQPYSDNRDCRRYVPPAGEPGDAGMHRETRTDAPYFGSWEEGRRKKTPGAGSTGNPINAFDFDGIVGDEDFKRENQKKGESALGLYTPSSDTENGTLPLKKAFLLSPEEKRKQARQKCFVPRSQLVGLVFVLQLDIRSLNGGTCRPLIAPDPTGSGACPGQPAGTRAPDQSRVSAGGADQTHSSLTPTVTISDHHLHVSVLIADPAASPAPATYDGRNPLRTGQDGLPPTQQTRALRKQEFLYRFPLPMCTLFAKGVVSSACPFLLTVVIPTDMQAAAAMETLSGAGCVPAPDLKAPARRRLDSQGTSDSRCYTDLKENSCPKAPQSAVCSAYPGHYPSSADVKRDSAQAAQAQHADTRNAGFANQYLDAVF